MQQRLWAPWRNVFVSRAKKKGCIFCSKSKSRPDKKNLIIERGQWAFVMLNLYPYNNGHLMIAPYRHISNITDLTKSEGAELFKFLQKYLRRLKKLLKAHGFNIGFNIGKASGAGYDRHIHMHVVPRWIGDTNFMPVVANTKVMPQSLDDLYKRLLACR